MQTDSCKNAEERHFHFKSLMCFDNSDSEYAQSLTS